MSKKCLTALITPFYENGNIDYLSLAKIIKRLLKEGSDGFVVCGTTAETPTLTSKERKQILHFVISQVKGKVPIYFGCGSNDTISTIQVCKEIEKEQIAGVLLVTPYYNKPSQEGLYRHFYTIAHSTHLPIMLYQVPSRCGVAMNAETIIRLVKNCENICALKYASHDLDVIKEVKKQCDLCVYSGEDGYLLEGLAIGMEGIVSVSSHLILPDIKQLMKQYEEQVVDPLLHKKVNEYAHYLFMESSPSPLKYLLSQRNECLNILRLPLVEVSDQTKKELEQFIDSTSFSYHI